MSWTIVGSCAMDSCPTPGESSCAVNCDYTCYENTWWCSYPHFTECGSVECNVKTTLPKATETCGHFITLHCGCSNVYGYARMQDCGPSTTKKANTSGYCTPTEMKKVGCISRSLFMHMCNCTDPTTYGHIGVRLIG